MDADAKSSEPTGTEPRTHSDAFPFSTDNPSLKFTTHLT